MPEKWRIWLRSSAADDWAEPVMATEGDAAFESNEDAEMLAAGLRAGSSSLQVRVLPDGRHPGTQTAEGPPSAHLPNASEGRSAAATAMA
jgi:hypothetical protein